jgi:nitrous oxide reductase accessory protein NosL
MTSGAAAQEVKQIKPTPADKCPVCGMFVAKYPDFLAEIIFQDGSYALFDGVKDMMKYYFKLSQYNPSKKPVDIKAIWVTDYYTLDLIDGFKSYYVLDSNVYGPMGRELITFKQEDEAKEFMKDHQGKAVLQFNNITENLIKTLD